MAISDIPDVQEHYKRGEELVGGTVGHLTSKQEQALKELWIKLLAHINANADKPIKVKCDQVQKTAFVAAELSSSNSEAVEKWYEANESIATNTKTQTVRDKIHFDDTHEPIVPLDFKPLFQDDASIRYFGHVFWQACMLHRNPDSYLLTFLRATVWDVSKAFERITYSINWRATQAIDRLMWAGELDQNNKTMESGLTMKAGVDKFGSPVFSVRVRLNNPRDRSEGDAERFSAYSLETMAHIARKYNGNTVLVYDFTNFKLENVDITFIKNLLDTINDTYPQLHCASLLFVNSWLFSGVWRMIKGLLDPVSAKSTIIVKDIDTLQTYIDRSQIVTEMGGSLPYKYEYVRPTTKDNVKMFDANGRKQVEDVFSQAVDAFAQETKSWISENTAADGSYISASRSSAAARFDNAAQTLDQYIRARSPFERTEM
ncbi:CRAL-TRIO domain-containing protein [Coemansia spiralis]|nr:CRAL-TRIO domain-containing protein [Coemansia spiralis]